MPRLKKHAHALYFLFLLLPFVLQQHAVPAVPPHRQFHVAPGGVARGAGSKATPWSLTYALSHPPSVSPGDTIWLHSGVYRGAFESALTGTPSAPIIVRQYPGERATLDNPTSTAVGLTIQGSHTWYWGFEITNTSREAHNLSGVNMLGRDTKCINLIIHDNPGNGVGSWKSAPNAEIYGCLVSYNGRQTAVDGHAHGIYVQNTTGRKFVRENIIAYTWAYGIHAYEGGGADLDSMLFEGNVILNSGILWRGVQFERNVLLGGDHTADGDSFRFNYSYYPATPRGGQRNTFGYISGVTGLSLTNNYWVAPGNIALDFDQGTRGVSMMGNVIYSTSLAPSSLPREFPQNSFYHVTRPKGVDAFVRPNAFEPGRAHIIVYNWDLKGHVEIDISSAGLKNGETYEVRDALHWSGPPIVTGTHTGASISIPLLARHVATPLGEPVIHPSHTLPEFGVFILIPRSSR